MKVQMSLEDFFNIARKGVRYCQILISKYFCDFVDKDS